MKASLQPGIARVNRITVGRDRTISFMGDEGRVYATPWLIGERLKAKAAKLGDQVRVDR